MDLSTIDQKVYEKGSKVITTVSWVRNLDLSSVDHLFKEVNKRLKETCDAREIMGCVAILEHLAVKYPKYMFGIHDMGHFEDEARFYGLAYIPRNLLIIFNQGRIFWRGLEQSNHEKLRELVKAIEPGVFMVNNIFSHLTR
jgi:hypothetical protein